MDMQLSSFELASVPSQAEPPELQDYASDLLHRWVIIYDNVPLIQGTIAVLGNLIHHHHPFHHLM